PGQDDEDGGDCERVEDEHDASCRDTRETRPVRPRATAGARLDSIVQLDGAAADVCRQRFDQPCALLRDRCTYLRARDDVLDGLPYRVAVDEPIHRLLRSRAGEGFLDRRVECTV